VVVCRLAPGLSPGNDPGVDQRVGLNEAVNPGHVVAVGTNRAVRAVGDVLDDDRIGTACTEVTRVGQELVRRHLGMEVAGVEVQ
jgi:hypothetical protein